MSKVFNIGIWKTGTKSSGLALSTLGYRVHSHFWPIETRLEGIGGELKLTQDQIAKIKNVSLRFDAFADSPWLNVYKYLYEWYPDAKFILSLRESAEKLAVSEYHHALAHGVPAEEMETPEYFMDRYTTHNSKVREFFSDKPGSLLEVCFECGDGWDKLCPFLDTPVPATPFPHINKRR